MSIEIEEDQVSGVPALILVTNVSKCWEEVKPKNGRENLLSNAVP